MAIGAGRLGARRAKLNALAHFDQGLKEEQGTRVFYLFFLILTGFEGRRRSTLGDHEVEYNARADTLPGNGGVCPRVATCRPLRKYRLPSAGGPQWLMISFDADRMGVYAGCD
jgi:hypothetical protein